MEFKNNLVRSILFLLSPLLTLPILIRQAVQNINGNNLVLISLCMALIAMITPPFADSYRHLLQYIDYSRYTLNGNSFILSNGKDFIYYTLSYFQILILISFICVAFKKDPIKNNQKGCELK